MRVDRSATPRFVRVDPRVQVPDLIGLIRRGDRIRLVPLALVRRSLPRQKGILPPSAGKLGASAIGLKLGGELVGRKGQRPARELGASASSVGAVPHVMSEEFDDEFLWFAIMLGASVVGTVFATATTPGLGKILVFNLGMIAVEGQIGTYKATHPSVGHSFDPNTAVNRIVHEAIGGLGSRGAEQFPHYNNLDQEGRLPSGRNQPSDDAESQKLPRRGEIDPGREGVDKQEAFSDEQWTYHGDEIVEEPTGNLQFTCVGGVEQPDGSVVYSSCTWSEAPAESSETTTESDAATTDEQEETTEQNSTDADTETDKDSEEPPPDAGDEETPNPEADNNVSGSPGSAETVARLVAAAAKELAEGPPGASDRADRSREDYDVDLSLALDPGDVDPNPEGNASSAIPRRPEIDMAVLTLSPSPVSDPPADETSRVFIEPEVGPDGGPIDPTGPDPAAMREVTVIGTVGTERRRFAASVEIGANRQITRVVVGIAR